MVTHIFLVTQRHIPDSYQAVWIPEYSLRNPKIASSEIHKFWNQESKNFLLIFTQEAPRIRKWFSGRSCIRSNWNLEMLIFEERGKPENPEKNLSEQSKVPTTNLTHSWPAPGSRRWEGSAITTTPSLLPRRMSCMTLC